MDIRTYNAIIAVLAVFLFIGTLWITAPWEGNWGWVLSAIVSVLFYGATNEGYIHPPKQPGRCNCGEHD